MKQYDEQLKTLRQQIARGKQLSATSKKLHKQCIALSERAAELEKIKRDEQADVDRLEGGSVSSFFYNVIGKKEKKLDKERQEAYAAKVNYDAVVQELHRAEEDLQRCAAELKTLQGCEEAYAALLQEKKNAIKASSGERGAQILQLEERMRFLENQGRELREAIQAGEDALKTADGLLSHLNSAEGWGTWDIIGGGMVSSLVKHSELDEAQEQAELLQKKLRRFQTELADVEISADMKVNMEGGMRLVDCFFDNVFVDWMVLDQISRSKGQAEQTVQQLISVLAQLRELFSDAEQEHQGLSEQLEQLVLNA